MLSLALASWLNSPEDREEPFLLIENLASLGDADQEDGKGQWPNVECELLFDMPSEVFATGQASAEVHCSQISSCD